MAMFVDMSVGDTVKVGEVIVSIQFKSSRKTRIKIDAPPEQEIVIKRILGDQSK
jgi:hypothetical protein